MRIVFEYDMQLKFSQPVCRHHYSLKCVPHDSARQQILKCDFSTSPVEYSSSYTDAFGNIVNYGQIAGEHEFFNVSVKGEALTGLDVYEEFDTDTDIYTVRSPYTEQGECICRMYDTIKALSPNTPYEKVLFFMKAVHEALVYDKDATTVKTTAEDALKIGRGVCQDYAHILISLLRKEGFAARYVVGMLIGEGESHAWAEVNLNGYWYGLDPTNNLLTDDQYIKISHGRDYRDCAVSRGVFYGMAAQTQKIMVRAVKK